MIYIVQSGDTLSDIANRYNTDINQLSSANGLSNPNNLSVGQSLFIPQTLPTTHIVSRGESLYTIGRMYNIPLADIAKSNPQIINPNILNVGDVVNLPDTRESIDVNGYAIANIRQDILDMTLPFLTYLSIFSYQAREDGNLTPLYEDAIISSALDANVAPIMVVTNILDDGFSSDLAHTILNNANTQSTLITNIISTLTDKNYYGVDIDFEYLYPEDRQPYLDFLSTLKAELMKIDKILSVAVAPKYRDNQNGLLYEAHDYQGIGEIADKVIIMTYEWGYIYGEPMAISPLNEVEAVLSYAITRIPPEKILMGMPNYAYDWKLPFTPGTSATVLSNNQARDLAFQNNAQIMYDNTSSAPYFNYIDSDGKEHVVWFDDARSIDARLNLVSKYNLAGVSYWTINNFDATNWSVLSNKYKINKVL